MQIHEDNRGQVLVLEVRGRLDSNTAPQFQELVMAHIAGGVARIVVNMTEVAYVSSAGLRAFFTASRKLPNGGLVLSGVRAQVFQVFSIAGFDQIFAFAPDLESAMNQV